MAVPEGDWGTWLRRQTLDFLKAPPRYEPFLISFFLTPRPKGSQPRGGVMPFSEDFDYEGEVPAPVSRKGRTTRFDGPVRVENHTPEIVDVKVVGERGLHIETLDVGFVEFDIIADADLDEGEVRELRTTFVGEVVAGEAEHIPEPGFRPVPKPENPVDALAEGG